MFSDWVPDDGDLGPEGARGGGHGNGNREDEGGINANGVGRRKRRKNKKASSAGEKDMEWDMGIRHASLEAPNELSAKEKALNVRRALKMAQVRPSSFLPFSLKLLSSTLEHVACSRPRLFHF